MRKDIDPNTFEVIRNALASSADEMALVIMRSAYSQVVRDTMDYSTGLCDRQGQVIAQGLTLPVQLGAFPDAMQHLLSEYGGKMRPGDVFIMNDPYGSGGQHLPDVYVIKPVFIDGTIEGYAAAMAHHSDVGGLTPGSLAIHASEIYQEGLRIPMLKLYEGGEKNETLFRIIEKNTRQPIQVLGDLRAQLAACRAGENGLVELIAKYGKEAVRDYLEELQNHAERVMRAEIARIPDGIYRFADYIDGVGESPEPIRISVTVEVKGEEITIDFAGTSAQVRAAINAPVPIVHSCCYCAIRCLVREDIPNCEGYMRPVRVKAPSGTIVNPVAPAACAARGVIGYRVFDAIVGALAQVVPERVIAGGEGGPYLFSVGGSHHGRPFVLTEVMVGTWGARDGRDGVEGISNPAANLSNQPVELIEAELPLEIMRYAFVPDSDGAGKYRGGLAFVREFKLLSEEAEFTVRADRRDYPPYGIAGGKPGAPSKNILTTGSDEKMLPVMPLQSFRIKKGDAFCLTSAGGGGSGLPLERAPENVLKDVIEEKVSVEAARSKYGVVIDSDRRAIDTEATRRLRAELARR
jgi:N-methylhydantoinase B